MAPVSTETTLQPRVLSENRSKDGRKLTVMDTTWRGNNKHTISLPAIEVDGDVYAQRKVLKEHLAGVFQFWGKRGYGEGLAGHITAMDPVKKDHYWMNPFGTHFSQITASKLVLVGPDGQVSEDGAQLPIIEAGFMIHSAVHKARPDAIAVAHCHAIHGKAWSIFGKPIEMLTQDSCLFYNNLSVYNNFGGVVLEPEEGVNIAKAMGPTAKACILQNHGLLTVGRTVFECLYLFESLERQCQVQLLVEAAASSGLKKSYISEKDAAYTAANTQYWEINHRAMLTEYNLLLEEKQGKFLE